MGGSAPKRKAKAKKNAKAGAARAAGPVALDVKPGAARAAAAEPPSLAAAAEARLVLRKAKPAKKKKAAKAKPAKRHPEAPAKITDASAAAAAADATAPAAPIDGNEPAAAQDEASPGQTLAEAAPAAGPVRKPGREKSGKAAKPRKVGAKKARGAPAAAGRAPAGEAPAPGLEPARAPKPRTQYGALLHRRVGDRVEIMLVSSRETRRWIIPKGWPIKGLKAHEAAAREAFEEAGVEGRIAKKALGDYPYGKRLPGGTVVPCRVRVFPMVVERERLRWPEMAERTTRWLGIEEAAGAVAEPELADLIRRFGTPSSPGGDQRGATAAAPNDDPVADIPLGDAAD